MKDDSLSVDLLINQHVKVILFVLDVDWHINTRAIDRDWNWLRIILILEEYREFLRAFGQLVRHEGQLNSRL